jgi:3-oxoacyl-[acyl-carrier-protein] synthase-1
MAWPKPLSPFHDLELCHERAAGNPIAMSAIAARIAGIGMMTPIGDCAAQTASSFRTGICRYRESSVYNKRFQPMRLALLPEDALPPLAEPVQAIQGMTSRRARMLRLATPALAEALADLDPEIRPALFLAVPETLPQMPTGVDADFLGHLAAQTGARFDTAKSHMYALGRAGGMHALQGALDALSAGASHVLLGGVDSYLDLLLLGTLDQQDRVLAEGVMDGFCPGEGAAFLLLTQAALPTPIDPSKPTGSAKPPHCVLLPPGLADEPGHRYSQEPYRGDGLANAIRAALPPLAGQKVRTVLASLNGENFGAKEWGVAYMRNKPGFEEPLRFDHPADCFGDTGAANGPLLLGLAVIGIQNGWLPSPCLVYGSSDQEQRGAACVMLMSSS